MSWDHEPPTTPPVPGDEPAEQPTAPTPPFAPPGERAAEPSAPTDPTVETPSPFVNTTLGAVITNARLDKAECHLVSQGAHDGFARALFPAHGRGDGDAVVTASVPLVDAPVDLVRLLAVVAVESAIRSVA